MAFQLCVILPLFVIIFYAFFCPFTKVEESFNIQALHDITYLTTNLSEYDHKQFPGVVPRTFIAPLFLSLFTLLFQMIGFSKYALLLLGRLTIGCWGFLSFCAFIKVINNKYGSNSAAWLVFITSSQFHFLFYMSRPLPNIFALILEKNYKKFIWVAAFSSLVFRSELVLLYGPLALTEMIFGRLRLKVLLFYAFPSALLSIGLSIAIDSLFWSRLLWPEGEVLWYNLVLNKSSNWGTSPFLWYFYSALPRMCLISLFFVPASLLVKPKLFRLAGPALLFVLLYSFLPHKELRFIIYVVPILNTCSAVFCAKYFRPAWHIWPTLINIALVGHILINVVVSLLVFFPASRANYPGAAALRRVHEMESPANDVSIHISVAAAQTGISKFLHNHDPPVNSAIGRWEYNKSESLTTRDLQRFTYLLVDAQDGNEKVLDMSSTHVLVEVIHGFSHISLKNWSVHFHDRPYIAILKRILT